MHTPAVPSPFLATAYFLLTMVLTAHPAQGQGMGGLLVGDRSGIDRSQANPASLSMTKNYLEFTLLGAHLHALAMRPAQRV